jgi:hypothetical protein
MASGGKQRVLRSLNLIIVLRIKKELLQRRKGKIVVLVYRNGNKTDCSVLAHRFYQLQKIFTHHSFAKTNSICRRTYWDRQRRHTANHQPLMDMLAFIEYTGHCDVEML